MDCSRTFFLHLMLFLIFGVTGARADVLPLTIMNGPCPIGYRSHFTDLAELAACATQNRIWAYGDNTFRCTPGGLVGTFTTPYYSPPNYTRKYLIHCYYDNNSGTGDNYLYALATTDCTPPAAWDDATGSCKEPSNNGGPSCPSGTKGGASPFQGNPINIAIGNKYQRETDFTGSGEFPLRFERHYNSWFARPTAMGAHWRHAYEREVLIAEDTLCDDGIGESCLRIHLIRPDGKEIASGSAPPEWTINTIPAGYQWILPPYVQGRLSSTESGFSYVDSNERIERYDRNGRLLSITDRASWSQVLSYDDDGRLRSVVSDHGRSIRFDYDANGRLSELRVPGDRLYRYGYDAKGNLASVTYPGVNAGSTRTYHYENIQFPHHLTGITDEDGDRYATWDYDDAGRAVISEHGNGQDRHTIDYTYLTAASNPRATVTNPLDKKTTYYFTTIDGLRRISRVEGQATPNCVAANRSYTYTPEGWLASTTDWKGNRTTYQYNARGLVIRKVEAVGTPDERLTTTEWHAHFRLPMSITEPGRVTEFTYDGNGKLLSRTISAADQAITGSL